VFILQIVKVLCFDALLEVFILQGLGVREIPQNQASCRRRLAGDSGIAMRILLFLTLRYEKRQTVSLISASIEKQKRQQDDGATRIRKNPDTIVAYYYLNVKTFLR